MLLQALLSKKEATNQDKRSLRNVSSFFIFIGFKPKRKSGCTHHLFYLATLYGQDPGG
jgi:hypothetical protein